MLDWCWSKAKLLTLSCSSDQAAAAFAVWPNLLMAPWWNRQQMFYEQSLDCKDFHCEISIFTRPRFGCVLERLIAETYALSSAFAEGACKRKGLQQRHLLPARSTRSWRFNLEFSLLFTSWIYLCKSGAQVAQGAQAQVHATTPSTVPGEGIWSEDWRLRFPLK